MFVFGASGERQEVISKKRKKAVNYSYTIIGLNLSSMMCSW